MDTAKQMPAPGHYEGYMIAIVRPPCQRCFEEGQVVPSLPPHKPDCPECGAPFEVREIRVEQDIRIEVTDGR